MLALTTQQQNFFRQSVLRDKRVRLELLNGQEQVLATLDFSAAPSMGQIIDGRIDVDATRTEYIWGFALQIADPQNYWLTGAGNRLWLDKRARISIGYVMPAPWGDGKTVQWFPRGVYVLQLPEVDATGGIRVVHLAGQDKFSLANGRNRGKFQQATNVAQNTNIATAIQTLASSSPWSETNFVLGNPNATVPWQVAWDVNSSPVQASQEIAAIPQQVDGAIYHLWYNSVGALALTTDMDPNNVASVASFQANLSGLSQLVGLRAVTDTSQFANAIRVRYGSAQGAVGEVLVTESNTASPTHPNQIGWYIWDYNNGQADALITSAAQATARGKYELTRRLAQMQQIPASVVEHPGLEPWDVVSFSDPLAPEVLGNYQVVKFGYSLTSDLTMSIEGRKVLPVGTVS